MDNPFVYSRPVDSADLVDRKGEAESLLSLARAGHNSRLSAPRRYGKTSLLRWVLEEAEAGGTPGVYVNFYGILSLEDAAARLERGYESLRGPLANWLTGALRTLRPTVAVPGTGVSISPELDTEVARRLLALLDLPRRVFQRGGERVIVVFDEFQEVLEPRLPLDGLIRSVIEQHTTEASYVFAGSHPGLMAQLFGDRERPFYGQARPVGLDPLPDEDLAEFLGNRFERTDRSIGHALGPLLDVVAGHPQRAMLLAHHLWERTERGGHADETTFLDALVEADEELREAFDLAWRGLGDGERRALAAVAASEGSPTRAEALAAVDLPRTTAVEALARLSDDGLLVTDPIGTRRFTDPFFGRWVAEGRPLR